MLKFHREFWAKNIIFKFDVESRDSIFLVLDGSGESKNYYCQVALASEQASKNENIVTVVKTIFFTIITCKSPLNVDERRQ